jgi:ZIP family zinc transporter
MPLGAFVASIEHIHSDWLQQEFRHSVIAFGAGALLSAVALVLVPEGIAHVSTLPAAICFIGGGLLFMGIDIYLNKNKTQAGQLAAMLADFIPESIALGAVFATGGNNTAYLLALLIALQNLPEGFNAYRELQSCSYSGKKVISLFILLAFTGPLAGFIGYEFLGEMPSIVAGIMLFAAGGILYAIFQDIAPQIKLEKHYAPPLGALLGFILGLVGFMVSHT